MSESGRSVLRAGVARRDITPPPGLDLSGFSVRQGAALGARDRLEVAAVVASDGAGTVALLAFDLIGLTPEWIGGARRRVARATGVPPGNQMYACTHTHCGPETGVLPSLGEANAAYLDGLIEHAESVIGEALDRQFPVRLVWGTGLSYAGANRRSAQVSPTGPCDGEIDEIDPTVVAAQLRTLEGTPVATLVNYGCHPTSSREHVYSAGYPGHLRAEVEAATGAPCVYVNGAGGDVNLHFASPEQRGLANAREQGTALAREALRALEGAPVSQSSKVGAASCEATLVYAERISVDEARRLIEEGQQALSAARTCDERRRAQDFTIAYAQQVLAITEDPEWRDEVAVEVQALRIGDLALVAVPVEFLSADGRAVRSAAPAAALMIAGWSNGLWGYVPTRRAFSRGGYEPDFAFRVYGHPAPWQPTSGDNLRTAALEATGRLFE